MARKGMILLFATITCDRCRGTRLMTQPCAECGFAPRRHETQPDLERRRKILRNFLAADVSPAPIECDLASAIASVPELMAEVSRALSHAARGGQDAHGIIQAFAKLDGQVAHWSQRHPRPHTNRARHFYRSLRLLREGYGFFAEALGAETMLLAQDFETRGQALLDAAAEEIGKLNGINEAERLLAGPAAFSQLGESARAAAGSDETLATLDERLQQMTAGPNDNAQVGIGLNLHILRNLMLVLFDLEQALQVAGVAEEQMGFLPPVCSSPKWQSRHGVVTAQFSTAAFNLSTIDESNDLEGATAALHLVMQCRDGIIRHCLATMFATDSRDYERLHQQGAGRLIKRATQRWPNLFLQANLSEPVRHAAAHFDYDIVDDHFITHGSSGEEVALSIDDFLDSVLGYFQTAVSLVMALTRATAAQGIELELSRHTPERDLFSVMSLMLGFLGFSATSVDREGTVLRVAATGDPRQMSTAAAGIAAVAPADLTHAEARINSPTGDIHSWVAPLNPFREYGNRPPSADEVDDVLALARVVSTIRVDGASVWDGDTWGGVAVVVFTSTQGMPLVERVRKFKEVRDLTLAAGLSDVAGGLTAILEGLRQSDADAGASSHPFAGRSLDSSALRLY